jgi:hypothetical protein
VEPERSVCGNANLVVRDCAENDGAGRSAEPVDDDGLARVPQMLVSIDVSSNLAAPVIHNPNRRITRPDTRQQEHGREQPSQKLHFSTAHLIEFDRLR